MTLYHISCINLQTTKDAERTIYGSLVEAMPNNHIEGIQRALFVLQRPFTDEIIDAYSTVAYFHSNENSPGAIRYEKEKKTWSEKDVKTRLKRNKRLEQTLEVERDDEGRCTVTLVVDCPEPEMPRHIDEGEKTKEVSSLEKHFENLGAFARTTKRRTKIINP